MRSIYSSRPTLRCKKGLQKIIWRLQYSKNFGQFDSIELERCSTINLQRKSGSPTHNFLKKIKMPSLHIQKSFFIHFMCIRINPISSSLFPQAASQDGCPPAAPLDRGGPRQRRLRPLPHLQGAGQVRGEGHRDIRSQGRTGRWAHYIFHLWKCGEIGVWGYFLIKKTRGCLDLNLWQLMFFSCL